MTEGVQIALIVAVPPTIASIASVLISLMNRRKIDKVDANVNGKMSELIEAKKDTAFLQGAAQERVENRERVLSGDDTLSGRN